MPSKLATMIRSKYPNDYNDMDDATLEKQVLSKHPEYKDLAQPEEDEAKPDLTIPEDKISSFKDSEKPKGGSFLSKAWHTISDPLTDAPSRFAKTVSDYIDNPQGEGGYFHGLAAGAIQGLGDVASSMTSPLNLAALASGAGEVAFARRGMGEAANIANLGLKAASVPVAAHGAYQTFRPDSSLSERGMGIAELAGGLAGMKSKVPEIASIAEREAPISHGPQFEDPAGLSWVNDELNKLKAGDYQSSERPAGPWNENVKASTEEQVPMKTAEDKIYDIARNKFNMGKEPIPEFDPGSLNFEDTLKASLEDRLAKTTEEPKPDLMDEYNKSTEGPVKAGTEWKDDNGNVIGHTTDTEGSTGVNFLEDQPAEIPVLGFNGLADQLDKISSRAERMMMQNKLSESELEHVDSIIDSIEGSIGKRDKVSAREAQEWGNQLLELRDNLNKRRKGEDIKLLPESTKNPKQAAEFGEQPLETQTGNQPPEKPPVKSVYSSEELDPKIPVTRREPRKAEELSNIRKLIDAPKGTMAVDLPFMTSAAFRQARPLAFTSDWFKAWGAAARAYGSDNAAKLIEASHLSNEYFKPRFKPITNKLGDVIRYKEIPSIAEEAGVKTTDLLNKREEHIASNLAEKIPGYGRYVKASNRAYAAFLNDLRVNKFTDMMNANKGMTTDSFTAQHVAEFVNDATGRGKLELKNPIHNLDFEKNAKFLGDVFWSPRNLSSQIKFFNPSTYTQADPSVRLEYVKGLGRILASWGAFSSLASLVPSVQVNTNPTNADFGKIRIGNTRIDPGGGYQPLTTLFARAITGQTTSSTTGKTRMLGQGFKPTTTGSLIEDFAANRLAPVQKLAYDIINATSKQPVKLGDRAVQMIIPFYVADIKQAAKDDPYLAAIAGISSSVGFGVQSYGKNDFGKNVFIPEESDIKLSNPYPLRGLASSLQR